MQTPEKSFRVPRSRTFETHYAMRSEILASLEPVLFGSGLAGYKARHELENAFANLLGQRFACAVHSGTIGLFLALRACGIGSGDEIITVANSDISTTSAIRHCGAEPILCDVQASDFNIDIEQVEALITPKTRALLPVDLYGHPADVRRLREIADRHGLVIIEDATLATGAADYGHPVGFFADTAVFSFAPFKPLGSVGNGAMIVTNDAQIAKKLHSLAAYGAAQEGNSVLPGHQRFIDEGYNIPLDPLQAALLQIKLSYIPEWTARRQAIAAAYKLGLKNSPVITPLFREASAPTFRCFTVRVSQRQRVYHTLRKAGIEVVIHYAPPVYHHPGYSGNGLDMPLPITEKLATELLCLPVTPELTDEDVAYTIQQLRNCF